MHRRSKIGIALAAVFSAAASLCAFDLYFDSGECDHPAIEPLAPSELFQFKADALYRFARAFSPRLFSDKVTEADVNRLLAAAEFDPSIEPLSLLTLIAKKNPRFSTRIYEALEAISDHDPELLFPAVIAGENSFERRDVSRAKKYLFRALTLLGEEDMPRTPIRRQAAFSTLCKLSVLLTLDGGTPESRAFFERLNRRGKLLSDPDFLRDELLHFYGALQQTAESDEQLPFYLATAAARLRLRLSEFISAYIAQISTVKPDRLDFAKHAPAFDVVERMGHGGELLSPLLNMIIAEPENEQALILLANFYASSGRHAAAARVWRNFLHGRKNVQETYLLEYAKQLRLAKFYRKAITAYELIRLKSPAEKQEMIELIICEICMDSGDYGEALKRARRVRESPARYMIQMLAAYRQKDFIQAHRHAKNAVRFVRSHKIQINGRDFWMVCAMAAEKRGDIAMVDELLTPLLELDSDDPELLNFIGYVFADHQYKLPLARKYIQGALNGKPDSPEILDSMAWILFRQGEFAKAKEFILKSLACYDGKDGKHADAVLLDHAGDIFMALGDKTTAVKYWTLALEAEPGDADPDAIRGKLEKCAPKGGK